MSDIKPAHQITHTMLPDGTVIHTNDHVYLSSEHLGEPYYIGRVMEFCTSSKRKGLQARIAWFNRPKDVINKKSADPCLLVATMHSDMNPVSSIRGKCTVTHKYYIPKDQMELYRKTPDNFYFNQLYDRYIQRVYDVVPCETVQNVPMDTLEALKQRYQFIVVEQGKAADLTVARRTCCVCQEWCSSAVSVKCAGCQKSFHMSCLNPPLARKPSKGFAWQCAFCTRQEVLSLSDPTSPVVATAEPTAFEKEQLKKEVKKAETKRQTRATRSQLVKLQQNNNPSPTLHEQEHPKAQSAPPAPISKSMSETSIKLKINYCKKGLKNQHIKMTHMWPFRYFGVNTNIRDILDVDDRIYPRAKSRIGGKYQAVVPEWDNQLNRSLSPLSDVRSPSSSNKGKSRKSDKKGKSSNVHKNNNHKRSAEASPADTTTSAIDYNDSSSLNDLIPTRGGNDTVTCIYRPGINGDEQLDDYMNEVKTLKNIPFPTYSSDLMDHALYELEINSYHTDIAFENMSTLDEDDFEHLEDWTTKEKNAFEQSIREHGHDLNFAKASVQTKSMAAIVRFFYQWKKTERYEPVYSEWTKVYRPMKKFKKFPRSKQVDLEKTEVEEDQEPDSGEESDPTIVPKYTYSRKSYQCMDCMTNQSKIWRRSPSDFDRKRKVFNKVLCDECGVYWLKYAKTRPITAEERNNNILAVQGNNTSVLNTNSNAIISNETHNNHINNSSKSITSVIVKQEESNNNSNQKRKRLNETQPSAMRAVPKRNKDEHYQQNDTHHVKFAPSPCKVCNQLTPGHLFTCRGCGLSVHEDCYGVKKDTEENNWLCDPCDNKLHPIASYVYECVLCFQDTHQPLKRTSGYYWAHIQCAAFIPEIKYVYPALLSPIEYVGCVNPVRLEAKCHLCNTHRGACTSCSECRKTVHISCAIENNFKLAFEIQPNASSKSGGGVKYPTVSAGLFGGHIPSGIMVPQVWCNSHHVSNSKKLVDLKSRTVEGESCLKVYATTFKGIPTGTTPAMRRFKSTQHDVYKARMGHGRIPNAREAALEALMVEDELQPATNTKPITVPTSTVALLPTYNSRVSSKQSCKSTSNSLRTRVCSTEGCAVQHTPIWWNVDENNPLSDKKICQKCHVGLQN